MPLPSLLPRRRIDAALSSEEVAELLRRIAAGERPALETLYRSYQGRLNRFLTRFTRRHDVIEEVINDTFWIVWQKAGDFRGESRASTWIMGIAYRRALKTLRDHGEGPLDPLAFDEASHATSNPQADHALLDWVTKGLSRLPTEQRMTMELAYCLGHSLEEIATIMDCPVSTVKARMFHARIKLRNLLPALATGNGTPTAPAGAEEFDE